MNGRAALEKELARVTRDHAQLVDAIIEGVPAAQVKDRMIALDTRRTEIETQLAAADAAPAPVRLHPKMSETYRERVAALIRGLAAGEEMDEAREALRGLIEKIVLTPRSDGPGVAIDLHGALANLLLLATGAPDRRHARPGTGESADIVEEIVLVAGVGFGLWRTNTVIFRV